eukprot:ANDGO_04674.mRNA.1 Para-nitrobenzyl esterase
MLGVLEVWVLAWVLALVCYGPGCSGLDASLIVATSSGTFRGYLEPQSPRAASWKGIPYAAAPTGPLRWRSPQPYNNLSTTVMSALEFQPPCMGQDLASGTFRGSEDCLYLNVWAPAPPSSPSPSSLLPVVVWIVGGGMTSADITNPTYSGRLYVAERESVVYVTFSYRVSVFGFFSSAALQQENGVGRGNGNWGVEDQRAALQWVKMNIAQFGGDPSRVTLQGESAGAHSVCYHLVSPPSQGLFHAAILESGSCDSITNEMDPVRKQALCDAFVATQSICPDPTDLQCLRNSLNTTTIAKMCLQTGSCSLLSPTLIGPALDGFNLPFRSPSLLPPNASAPFALLDLLAQGSSASVPLLIGFNRDEFALSALLFSSFRDIDANGYRQLVLQETGGNGPLAQAYLDLLYTYSPLDAAIKLRSEQGVVCPARRLAQIYASRDLPVYVYSFDHAPRHSLFQALPQLRNMAFHSAELAFVFGIPGYLLVTALDSDEALLGTAMRRYWLSFAESQSSPNAAVSQQAFSSLAQIWPRYTSTSPSVLQLNVTSLQLPLMQVSQGPPYTEGRCLLWDAVQFGPVWNAVYNGRNQSANGNAACSVCSTVASDSSNNDDAENRSKQALVLGSIALTLSILLALASVLAFVFRSKAAKDQQRRFANDDVYPRMLA